LTDGTEENYENSQHSWSPDRDLIPQAHEYEEGMLTTRSLLSMGDNIKVGINKMACDLD
jgi:hypothetical protein